MAETITVDSMDLITSTEKCNLQVPIATGGPMPVPSTGTNCNDKRAEELKGMRDKKKRRNQRHSSSRRRKKNIKIAKEKVLSWDDDTQERRPVHEQEAGLSFAPYNTTQFIMEQHPHNHDEHKVEIDFKLDSYNSGSDAVNFITPQIAHLQKENTSSDVSRNNVNISMSNISVNACVGSEDNHNYYENVKGHHLAFIAREFKNTYNDSHEEEEAFDVDKHALVQEYFRMEKTVEDFELKLKSVRERRALLDWDSNDEILNGEIKMVPEVAMKIRIFQEEISRLTEENEILRNRCFPAFFPFSFELASNSELSECYESEKASDKPSSSSSVDSESDSSTTTSSCSNSSCCKLNSHGDLGGEVCIHENNIKTVSRETLET